MGKVRQSMSAYTLYIFIDVLAIFWFLQHLIDKIEFICPSIMKNGSSKFDHVVSSLSPGYDGEVRDLIISPPSDQLYQALKEQLTKRTAQSEQHRLQQLFRGEELGD